MNQYVTGAMIRRLRESRKMTQHQLAEKLSVSDKVISKWETGRGYPDISLIEPLSVALGVSIIELFFWREYCQYQQGVQYAADEAACLSDLRECDTEHRRGDHQLLWNCSATAGGGTR